MESGLQIFNIEFKEIERGGACEQKEQQEVAHALLVLGAKKIRLPSFQAASRTF